MSYKSMKKGTQA